jgi:hypothetical protein
MKKSVSWGNYPKGDLKIEKFNSDEFFFKKNSIPYGNGRSYGDSCISNNLIDLKEYDEVINYDNKKGLIIVQSGVLVDKILNLIVKDGWFLPVVAGTKLITIGGAIASDIHGKNHHLDGCFSEHIKWLKILLPNGKKLTCSKNKNRELFLATCGGMGLTGIILQTEIKLKKINSTQIKKTTIKTENLKDTFRVFNSIKNEPYSVAWIDCLSKNEKLGKGIVSYGKFLDSGVLNFNIKRRINIPFYFPHFVLSKYSVKLFNWVYYNRIKSKKITTIVNFDSFFFPLDIIKNWNRIYGKKGFLQYQFILPKKTSYKGLLSILKKISESGKGSFLAVLKLYGKENDNYLSFPKEGYSLALDFKIEKGVFKLLNELDKIVLKYDGRIYLSKDSRVSKKVFEKGYPNINKFRNLRKQYNLNEMLTSKQAERIGI